MKGFIDMQEYEEIVSRNASDNKEMSSNTQTKLESADLD